MANDAFDMMNSADPDMHVTGGAILVSEYEQNMNPGDQSKYEKAVMNSFQSAYAADPYKRNLDFQHWLGSLDPNLYRERAKKYEDIKAQNNGYSSLVEREDGRLLEDAGMIQSLAHLHTGRIEDLIEIVSTMEPGETPFEQAKFRRP